VVSQGIVAAGLTLGSFTWTGNFTTLNLIAATTNALNGPWWPADPTTTATTQSSACC
jgi:hypothetical protein